MNGNKFWLLSFSFSLLHPYSLWIFCFSASDLTPFFKRGVSTGGGAPFCFRRESGGFLGFLKTLTWGLFVDIMSDFNTVSTVFPKGEEAWFPCGMVFDWCSLSSAMWCVHWCGGDGVWYPYWRWSGEQLAHVPHSHSGFTVVSHHIFPPHYEGACFCVLARENW